MNSRAGFKPVNEFSGSEAGARCQTPISKPVLHLKTVGMLLSSSWLMPQRWGFRFCHSHRCCLFHWALGVRVPERLCSPQRRHSPPSLSAPWLWRAVARQAGTEQYLSLFTVLWAVASSPRFQGSTPFREGETPPKQRSLKLATGMTEWAVWKIDLSDSGKLWKQMGVRREGSGG